MSIALLIVQLPSVSDPSPRADLLEGPLVIEGSTLCYRTGLPCTFTVRVNDAQLIFFRWDLNGDGMWDFPDRGGGGSTGTWTTDTTVTVGPGGGWYDPAIRRVCVQGWNGIDTVDEGGVTVARGPNACTNPTLRNGRT